MNHHQKQKLQDLAQSTAAHLEQFGHTLQSTLIQAPEKLDQIRETVGPALEKLYDTFQHVENRVDESKETASRLAHEAQRRHRAVHKVLVDPKYSDHDSGKFVWLLIGLGAGALLGLFLAPASGRRNRAKVRDQFNKQRHTVARATSIHATDLSNKAKGLSHKIQQTICHTGDDENVTDEILADRVRTALGQNPDTRLPHLNIECCEGVVTLHGPTVDVMQEATLINAVQNIPGVIDVNSKLPISSES
jgi:gas vesicle protein